MKNPFIASILLCFMCMSPAFAQDRSDYKILSILASGDQTLMQNLMKMISKPYRYKSEPVLRGQSAPYLARIQSSYFDEATKKWETVQGLGSFVKIEVRGKKRTAVLTVSHLTQGKQLRIYDPKNRLVEIEPGMRLADIDDDVELIVLKNQLETPLEVAEDQVFFRTKPLKIKELTDDMDFPDYDRIYVSKKQHVPILKSLLPKNSSGHTIETGTQGREDAFRKFLKNRDLNDVLKSPKDIMLMLATLWDADGVLQEQLVGYGYIAGARMLPGLSGAPLIRDMPYSYFLVNDQYVYSIDGLVQGHHRFENKSYFVGVSSIGSIVEKFRKGSRQHVSATRWRMKNGMTFRDFGNGVLEVSMVKTPSGSIFKGDSGNAISVDGDYDPTAHGFGLGIQDGKGNNIVGQFMKINGMTLPVMADPRFKQNRLPRGMEEQGSFGSTQGLWDLANMKYQFRDQITDIVSPYECFYQVTEKGIDLQVNKFKGENVVNWHGAKGDLQKGFSENSLFARDKNGKSAVELSGLFLTDLGNVVDRANIKSAGAPTVTILSRDGQDASRVGCFNNPEERKNAYLRDRSEVVGATGQLLGTPVEAPPSPF